MAKAPQKSKPVELRKSATPDVVVGRRPPPGVIQRKRPERKGAKLVVVKVRLLFQCDTRHVLPSIARLKFKLVIRMLSRSEEFSLRMTDAMCQVAAKKVATPTKDSTAAMAELQDDIGDVLEGKCCL